MPDGPINQIGNAAQEAVEQARQERLAPGRKAGQKRVGLRRKARQVEEQRARREPRSRRAEEDDAAERARARRAERDRGGRVDVRA